MTARQAIVTTSGGHEINPATGLTERQALFVSELILNGGNMSKAAERAGYAESSAYQRGWELMQMPRIQQAVANARRKLYQGMAVEALNWIKEAMMDKTVSATVKKDIALAIVDRAGDRQPEVLEIVDKRKPNEISDKLALLLNIAVDEENVELITKH